MALIACVSTVVSCVFQPLMDALQSAAGDMFSFLRGWAAGEIRRRLNAVVEVPASSVSIVGAEETLQEIRSCLRDDSVGIVGIYGMGGVGKTTLLKRINNDFFESGTQGLFDLVIWVTVSREINVARVQKEIGGRVGLSFSAGDSAADGPSSSQVGEQAKLLFQALSKRRFLLLLDDLWEKLDLIKVGIPSPERRRHTKIVFTTRSRNVCTQMDAKKIVKVEVLDDARSWDLFCTKLSPEETFKNPSVKPLAELVVAKCGGLPLALITVGRAMALKTLPDEWRHAVKALDDSAEKIRGMDEVLSALKFSYDNLQSDMMRSALLFCAMYPEDFDILREELIEYWVGEGLLDDDDDGEELDDTRNRGHVLISDLQSACLLETGNTDAEGEVRMHDAVRDMALWMNRHEYDKIDGFLVFKGGKSTPFTKMPRKELVRRVWMRWFDWESSPPRGLENCPNTWTLLLDHFSLGASVLQGLLGFMRTLRVLDLSVTGLEEVPEEIGLLVELQYLNLSWAYITSLPKELGDLIRLRQLVLEYTEALRAIPWESIGRLSHLQVLNMWHTGYRWDHGKRAAIQDTIREGEGDQQQNSPLDANASGGAGRQLELGDLEDLRRLQELRIDIDTRRALERLLSSNTLCRCTRRLCLNRYGDDQLYGEGGALLQKAFRRMGDHLRQLELWGYNTHPFEGELRFSLHDLPCLEKLMFVFHSDTSVSKVVVEGCNGGGAASNIPSLRELYISFLEGFKALILVGRFPCLERIDLSTCSGMEEVVLGDDDGVGRGGISLGICFPMLKKMELLDLPGLKSIGPQALLLPSLETMSVRECPQLRRLPLGPGGAPKLREIVGRQEWWDALQWDATDGGSTKLAYASCFRPF